MNKILFSLIITLISASLFAQSIEEAKTIINRTETSINKAQKEMIAGFAAKKPLQLSNAIKLQALAVQTLQLNDLKLAVLYSFKAREFSNSILIEEKLKGIEFYLLNDFEINFKNTQITDEIYKNFKYEISSIPIDEEILFDELRSNFKLSAN